MIYERLITRSFLITRPSRYLQLITTSTTVSRVSATQGYHFCSSVKQSYHLPVRAERFNQQARSRTTLRNFFNTTSLPQASAENMASATSFYEFKTKDKKGQEYPLSQHQGKVILAVNTASKCGFTPQFGGLESLWKKIQANEQYKNDFVILGFPCNQFNNQDPGSNEQIQEFCQLNYGVTFPVLGKTDVNGSNAEPVWEWMKAEKPGMMGLKRIKWNFEKFLIGRDGKVVNRWASLTSPEKLEADILRELEKPKPTKAGL